MPVHIPAPVTNTNNLSDRDNTSYLNRYNYYRAPLNLGRESNSDDYDYLLDITISTGKYALPKKNDYQLPKNHLAFEELEDSEGIKGIVSARTIEASIFYFGGVFNNYAAKCRTDTYLADIEHIENLPITEEEKEKYKQDRPRIKGIWMMPFKGSTYSSDNLNVISYYDPYGSSKLSLDLPNGSHYEPGQSIRCADCGLCYKKFDNEFKDLKGRTEYYLYLVISKIGKTNLENPFPARLVCTSTAFSSIHNLLYTLSASDPTKEIYEHNVKLSLEAVLGRDGKPLPNCYSIISEISGETQPNIIKLINDVIELNTYKLSANNNSSSNTSEEKPTATKTNSSSKSTSKSKSKESSQEDDFDW